MTKLNLSLVLLLLAGSVKAQQIIPLYTGTIPNATSYTMQEIATEKDGRVVWYRKVSKPTLTIFLPAKEKASGAGVILFPGGGYSGESYEAEGVRIAETFIAHGVAAFVVKYRLPSDSIMVDKSIGPLQDAQRAIQVVRERAAEWNLSPDKIGIMGFSAGGHLAATAGTHFNEPVIGNPNATDLRPDFMILVYPVISMTEVPAHKGSRANLLGENPTAAQIERFSNELHVTIQTPPTYLTHAGDDTVVDVDNSIAFYEALRHHKVPAEMHLYPNGNHGFVLKLPTEEWMVPLFTWMKGNGWVK
ncbi:alpha/beta hydrolase [Salmonirosea aquatica]|uniref:Alpha/beta hydrolase fold domain-containing protein n=1 Tax=Salmonirosea aquatica TaxID=2654236 RepID=A0A7C9FS93_9BACT|nr:alpha/beta hydrolase fold domain-containing protein [Cytophagaceae bacterium SJW1-29]